MRSIPAKEIEFCDWGRALTAALLGILCRCGSGKRGTNARAGGKHWDLLLKDWRICDLRSTWPLDDEILAR